MKTTKATTYAFIVRFWIEPRELKGAEPIWLGVIEPVEGQQRLYLDHLDKMSTYFARYLNKIGVKLDEIGNESSRSDSA